MAALEHRLTGNYYIAWLSRCDDAWRWLLSDRGPYTPMHVLKKQHHADCQRIAKEMLLTQLADKMQAKRLGLKSNPGKRHSAGFASRAQQRWAFGTGQSFARRWARKTTFKGLPERVRRANMAKKVKLLIGVKHSSAAWYSGAPRYKAGTVVPVVDASNQPNYKERGLVFIDTPELRDDGYGIMLEKGDYKVVRRNAGKRRKSSSSGTYRFTCQLPGVHSWNDLLKLAAYEQQVGIQGPGTQELQRIMAGQRAFEARKYGSNPRRYRRRKGASRYMRRAPARVFGSPGYFDDVNYWDLPAYRPVRRSGRRYRRNSSRRHRMPSRRTYYRGPGRVPVFGTGLYVKLSKGEIKRSGRYFKKKLRGRRLRRLKQRKFFRA